MRAVRLAQVGAACDFIIALLWAAGCAPLRVCCIVSLLLRVLLHHVVEFIRKVCRLTTFVCCGRTGEASLSWCSRCAAHVVAVDDIEEDDDDILPLEPYVASSRLRLRAAGTGTEAEGRSLDSRSGSPTAARQRGQWPRKASWCCLATQAWLRRVGRRSLTVARRGLPQQPRLTSTAVAPPSAPRPRVVCSSKEWRLNPPTRGQRITVCACIGMVWFASVAVLPHAGWILGAGHTFAFGLHGAHCGAQITGGARPAGDTPLRGSDWDLLTGDWDWGWTAQRGNTPALMPYFSLPLRVGASLQLSDVAVSSASTLSSSAQLQGEDSAVLFEEGEAVHIATLPALASAWALQAAAEVLIATPALEGKAQLPTGLSFLDAACDPEPSSQGQRLRGSAQELLTCLAACAVAVSSSPRGTAPAVGADAAATATSNGNDGDEVFALSAIAVAARIRSRTVAAFGLDASGLDIAVALLASAAASSRVLAVADVHWRVIAAESAAPAAPGLFSGSSATTALLDDGCIRWRWIDAPMRLRSRPDLLLQATVVGAPVCGAVHIRYGGRSGNALLETGVAALLARWLAAARTDATSVRSSSPTDASLRGGQPAAALGASKRSLLSAARAYAVLPEDRLSGGLGAHTALWTALCPHVPRLALTEGSIGNVHAVRVTNGQWGKAWGKPSEASGASQAAGSPQKAELGLLPAGSLQLPGSWFRPLPFPLPLPLFAPAEGWRPRLLAPTSWLPPWLSPWAIAQSVWPPTPWTSLSSSLGAWAPASLVLHDRYRWGQWAVQNLQQAIGISSAPASVAADATAASKPPSLLPRSIFMNHYFERGDMVGAAAALGWQALQQGLPRMPGSAAVPEPINGRAAIDDAAAAHGLVASAASRKVARQLHPFLPEAVASRAAAIMLQQLHSSVSSTDETNLGSARLAPGSAAMHQRCFSKLSRLLNTHNGGKGSAEHGSDGDAPPSWAPLLLALYLDAHAAALPSAHLPAAGSASDIEITSALNRSAAFASLLAASTPGQAADDNAVNALWQRKVRALQSAPAAAAAATALAALSAPQHPAGDGAPNAGQSVLDVLLSAVTIGPSDSGAFHGLSARLQRLLYECTLTVHVRAGDVALEALEWDYGRYLAALEAADAAATGAHGPEPAPGGALEAHLREEGSSGTGKWSSRMQAAAPAAATATQLAPKQVLLADDLFLFGPLASVFARYARPLPGGVDAAALPPLTCSSTGPRSQLTDAVTSLHLQRRADNGNGASGTGLVSSALRLLDPRSWTIAKEVSYPTAASLALARWMSRWQHDDPAAVWSWAPQFQGQRQRSSSQTADGAQPEVGEVQGSARHYLLDLLEAHCVAQGHTALPLSFYQGLLLGRAATDEEVGSAGASVSAIEARYEQRAADLQLLMAAAAVSSLSDSAAAVAVQPPVSPSPAACRKQLQVFLQDRHTAANAPTAGPPQLFECSIALLFPSFAAAAGGFAEGVASEATGVTWLHAHLVTERSGLSHPLLRAVAAASGASVQSTSLAGDWATMITARQLAISPSTLSYLSAGGGAPAAAASSASAASAVQPTAHGPGFGLSSIVHYPGHGFFSWFAPRGSASHDKGQCMIPPVQSAHARAPAALAAAPAAPSRSGTVATASGTSVIFHDILAAQAAASEQNAARARGSTARGCLADPPSSFLFQTLDSYLSRVSTAAGPGKQPEQTCGHLVLASAWPPDGYQDDTTRVPPQRGSDTASADAPLLDQCDAATGALNGFPICACEFERWPAAPLALDAACRATASA